MRPSPKLNEPANACADTYAFSEVIGLPHEGRQMALLALSHTKVEHQLYEIMLDQMRDSKTRVGEFRIRDLMARSGFQSYSAVRRGRIGLINKMSIDRHTAAESTSPDSVNYFVYTPAEIFYRRQEAGLRPFPRELMSDSEISTSGEIIERLVENHDLSRREVQVAFRCAQGLTNAKIGEKLFIHEETVKFHLRNIYKKFGVKRRTELMAHLFLHGRPG